MTYHADGLGAGVGASRPVLERPAGHAGPVAAVRAKFASYGGQSPAYFVCLAQSLGYEVTIEEPTQFFCDDSECAEPALIETFFHLR